ncbi:C1 family peptidase [Actinoplanes sp. NPDC051411]|uniref:C1 family peptidase n=1 Tax=Actinoplanes sp. NPDC051411 TaxID=3155522 RepID=UPI003430C948
MTTPTPRQNGRFGWVPDLPDHRDHIFSTPAPVLSTLPPSVDLRPQCPPTVYDQGDLGSCTANAIGGAFEFDLLKQGSPDFMPSRLFIYYNERVILGTVDSDSGAMIRDGIKSVNKQGVCTEDDWKYAIERFTEKPPASCYRSALDNQSLAYQRIPQTLNQLRGCLAGGYPFVFGFTVYESFRDPRVTQTGEVRLPAAGETVLGGHAVLAVGYDDATARFSVRNSWGPNWGDGGYFTMPYAYLTDRGLASDFWKISKVE